MVVACLLKSLAPMVEFGTVKFLLASARLEHGIADFHAIKSNNVDLIRSIILKITNVCAPPD